MSTDNTMGQNPQIVPPDVSAERADESQMDKKLQTLRDHNAANAGGAEPAQQPAPPSGD